MRNRTHRDTDIRKDILLAIDKAFPDGIVEDTRDPDEEDYLGELYPKLRQELSRVKGAAILYERDPSPRAPARSRSCAFVGEGGGSAVGKRGYRLWLFWRKAR